MRNNSIALRYDFENAAMVFAKAFNITPEQVKTQFKLTQSYLRLEQPFSTTSTNMNFPVLNNIQSASGTQFITEKRLNQQDSFIPTMVGIFVAAPASSTDAAFTPYAYLSPSVFGTANANAMRTFYNGFLSISVNNIVVTPAWDVLKHWASNQTQLLTAAPASGAVVEQQYQDSDGYFPMQPYVALIGSKNIQINIAQPAAPSAITASSRAIIIFQGILAQNSTVVV